MRHVGRRVRVVGAARVGDAVPRGRLRPLGLIGGCELDGACAAAMQPSPGVLSLQSIGELRVHHGGAIPSTKAAQCTVEWNIRSVLGSWIAQLQAHAVRNSMPRRP